jgi:hypothetical protein
MLPSAETALLVLFLRSFLPKTEGSTRHSTPINVLAYRVPAGMLPCALPDGPGEAAESKL